MTRVKRAVHAKKKKRSYFKAAKGYRGGRSRLLRTVKEAVDRARCYAYRDRKNRKREFRRLWIQRLNAGVRQLGLSYSRFIYLLDKSQIEIDRKTLAHMAMHDFTAFSALVEQVKQADSSSEGAKG